MSNMDIYNIAIDSLTILFFIGYGFLVYQSNKEEKKKDVDWKDFWFIYAIALIEIIRGEIFRWVK